MVEVQINQTLLTTRQDDITRVEAEAIVNAANSSLLGGGGVDGAIHRVGGPAILEECRALGGCPPGQARITTAGRLPAAHVIHAVGPVWHGGSGGEATLLHSAYTASLRLADEHALTTIALPSISTGAYGYPLDQAARIAVTAVHDHVQGPTSLRRVTFVLFSSHDLQVYDEELRHLQRDQSP